ncbi:cytochrome c biogenesis protein, partial [Streptomyces albidoflavus]
MLRDLANPTRFMAYSGRLLPWIAGLAVVTLVVGLYMAWFVAPADYQQGETVRIMYIHVPAAWLGLFFYTLMAAERAVTGSKSSRASWMTSAAIRTVVNGVR